MFYVGKNVLRILIDPLSVHLDASHQLIDQQIALSTVLHYLPSIAENKINVEIIFPKFLWDSQWKENYYSFVPGEDWMYLDKPKDRLRQIRIIEKRETINDDWTKLRVKEAREYLLDKKGQYLQLPKIDPKEPKSLLKSVEDGSLLRYRDAEYLYDYKYLDLVDLYFQYRCDYMLTSNRVLTSEKLNLAKRFRLFTTDYPDIYDEVETFLKGHNIYISTVEPIYGLGASEFYPMTDHKWRKYYALWGKLIEIKNDTKMSEYLRVLFYHRYSFIKLSIDQIKFNLLQAERLEDEGLRQRHYYLASYYLNSFYLNLWGFLDNLAWIFNYLLSLGFTIKTAQSVSFSSKKYRTKLKSAMPQLYELLTNHDNEAWLTNLATKRHPAAHREPLFLSSLYEQGSMKLMSDKMVVVNTPEGRGMFEGVKHFNYDVEYLDKFMDSVYNLFLKNVEP